MQTQQANKPAATSTPPAPKRPLWPKLLTVVVLLGIVAIAVSLLPRGFSEDTSLIGKGSNIVVLFYDPFTTVSMDNMYAMDALRGEYDGRVKFIVADKNVPQGVEFTRLYGVNSSALVFFAPNGEKISIFYNPQNAESLRENINKAFHF